jgi:PAS domain S-box-containing protein
MQFEPTGTGLRDLVETFDWGSTPLGSKEHWPKSLGTLAELVLRSSFPMFLLWGPRRTFLYNDAYVPILGTHHPEALGSDFFEIWPEVRAAIEPVIDQAYRGIGSHFENLPVELRRFGYPEQTWFTFSYSPTTDDEGAIAGALCICVETTQSVLKNERQTFITALRERLRSVSDPDAAIEIAQESLGRHLGANRVGYGSVDPSGRYFTTDRNWTDGSVPNHNGTHDLAAFGEPVHAAIKHGESLAIHDVGGDERTLPRQVVAAFSALEVQAGITVSLVKEGRLVAVLYVHQSHPRYWSESDLATVEEVAEVTWSALERQTAERKQRLSEERYRRIFEQASDLIITADLNQVITDCNPAAAEAVGLPREQALGRSISEFVSHEDFDQTSDMLRRKLKEGGTTRYDVRVRNKEGAWLYWEINSGLATGVEGRPVGLHVIGRDVTERKLAEEHQRLLINELNHRVKNTLAVVQSIAQQTLRAGDAPADVQTAFVSRLAALAAAHDILTRENWTSASMREIIENALTPFCGDGRCRIEGADRRLNSRTAVSLALAIHELATNASKYGALSNAAGSLSIRWTEEADRLRLIWTEQGGPQVVEPSRRGFGSRMIERAFAGEVQGAASLRFEPDGLICEVDAPSSSFA